MLKMKFIAAAVLLTAALLQAQDPALVIRFVRHGQPGVKGTDFTPADKAAWITLGLTPLGRKQAETTGQFLKKENIPWKKVMASPQERAAETANIICGILGKTYTFDLDLREVGNAVQEPLPGLRKRFKQLDPEEKMEATPAQRRGFKEDNKACGQRGRRLIMKLIRGKTEGPVLLVSHGHFMYCTILEMTGKSVRPWNCGMAELKVWPDGKAELVREAYPEVMGPDLITDNFTYFRKNPWYLKFRPHPGPRPETLDFVNTEFRLLLDGKNSAWREIRRRNGKTILDAGKGITFKSAKQTFGYSSPAFPLMAGKEYRIAVKASGKGTGTIRLAGSPYQKKLELTPEVRGYELAFTLKGKTVPFYTIYLEAAPASEMAVTDFSFAPVQ